MIDENRNDRIFEISKKINIIYTSVNSYGKGDA